MAEDKQFAPSQRRLQKAREQGQVPQSRDLTAAGVLALLLLAAPSLFRGLSWRLLRSSDALLGHLHEFEPTPAGAHQLLTTWGGLLLLGLAPLLGLAAAAAVFLSYLQSGPLLTTYPLVPRLDKLNPAQSLKRVFSLRGLVESLKSLLKVGIVGAVAYVLLRQRAPGLLWLGQMPTPDAAVWTGGLLRELALKSTLALVILGAADYAYQRFENQRALRMTREEMRQETKESEGDPQVRGQRRRQRVQLLRDAISKHLPEATVVITNPTHVAVALRYQPGEMAAPVVVARGRGRLAARLRRLARRYGVPLQEDPPLARALYRACPLGAEVPAALYRAVAVILAELQRQARRRQRRIST